MMPGIFGARAERRLRPFVLLEIGMLHIRLHSVEAAKDPIRIQLLREQSLTPGNISQLMQAVENMLDVQTDIRDLAIVMNSPAIRHQILSIPHMNRTERQRVLQFETKNLSPAGEEAGAIAFWSAGKIREQDALREKVLCAVMQKSVADGLIEMARAKNFRMIGLTSYAQMASQLLKECRPGGGSNSALLEVSAHRGSITLFHSNIWNMERHFLIGGTSVPPEAQELSEPDAEKLQLEVGRALQYFKQQVRNENISQIFLFGATAHADAIKKTLETSFRIPVTPIVREGKRFATGDSNAAQADTLPLFEIVHAAALHSDFERYISFLPFELRQEGNSKVRQLVLAGSAVALYALIGGAAYLLNQEVSKISTQERSEMSAPVTNEQALKRDLELQTSRSFAMATTQADGWLRKRHSLLAKLARELASSVPPQMRISVLEAKGTQDGWQISLEAEIRSSNGSRSQQLLLKFQNQMRNMSCLKRLTWGDVQLTDLEPSTGAEGSEQAPNSLLTFTMKGFLNPEDIQGKEERIRS